jgi:hypothetical protein
MAIREWLRMKDSDVYRDGMLKVMRRWDRYVMGLGDYIENNHTLVQQISYV